MNCGIVALGPDKAASVWDILLLLNPEVQGPTIVSYFKIIKEQTKPQYNSQDFYIPCAFSYYVTVTFLSFTFSSLLKLRQYSVFLTVTCRVS